MKKVRMEAHAELTATITRLVEKYGVEDQDRLGRALLHFCPAMTYEEREIVQRTGKPPTWWLNEKSKPTEGFRVRVKGEWILTEYWYAGKKQRDMVIEIPVAEWPVGAHPMFANVAYEQHELVLQRLVGMYLLCGRKPQSMADPEVWSDITRNADKIVSAINKKLPRPTPGEPESEDAGPKHNKKIESYLIAYLGDELVSMPLLLWERVLMEAEKMKGGGDVLSAAVPSAHGQASEEMHKAANAYDTGTSHI